MTKTYGIANDEIPQDEMLLGQLVQNAKAFGLKPCRNTEFRDKYRHNYEVDLADITNVYHLKNKLKKVLPRITACCALGASRLAVDTNTEVESGPWSNIAAGNDYRSYLGVWESYESEEQGGFTVGRAFQDALR